MNGEFNQILGKLRKRRRISQRQVAADLYISQALLSHYENGIREPGLDFVNRTCDYYGVTADFLLGRTKEGGPDLAGAESDSKMGAHSLLQFLQAVSALDNEALSQSAINVFGTLAYRLLRHMAAACPKTDETAYAIPENRIMALTELAFFQGEMHFLDCLDECAGIDSQKCLIPEQLGTLLLSLDKQIAEREEKA